MLLEERTQVRGLPLLRSYLAGKTGIQSRDKHKHVKWNEIASLFIKYKEKIR